MIILGLITIITIGCGGGGGGGGSSTASVKKGDIDASTAPKLASTVGNIVTGTTATTFPITLETSSGIYAPGTLLKHVDDAVFSTQYRRQIYGSTSNTESCSDEGTVALAITWDGPDDPTYCNQVKNPYMQFVYGSCREGSITLNGTMVMYVPGDICSIIPTAFSMDFYNFRSQDQVTDTDLSMDVSMDFSNIQYDTYNYMTGMNCSIDGLMSGTVEGTAINLSYNNFNILFSNLEYDAYDNFKKMTATLNGSFSGTIYGESLNENYSGMIFTYEETTSNSLQGILYSLNGQYKGSCLDGWITFQTITPVFQPYSSDCPTSGHITITGNGEATVVFKNDHSTTITVDDQTLEYTTCEDLPSCN